MKLLLADLYSANNRGDYLIARGTIELLRKVWEPVEISGMTTFRDSSMPYLTADVGPYRAILKDVRGNPSGVVPSPTESEEGGARVRLHSAVGGFARVLTGLLRARLLGRRDARDHDPVLAYLRQFDFVAFVGGAYLDACTMRDYPLLLSHLYPAYLSAAGGVRYGFLGESICGGDHVVPNWLMRRAFSNASLVVFRETPSFESAQRHGLLRELASNNVAVLPDLALGLTEGLERFRTPRARRSPVTVGVAFRRWSPTRVNPLTEDPAKLFARAISGASRRLPMKVVLVPFSGTPPSRQDNDLVACRALEGELRSLGGPVSIETADLPSPDDLDGLAQRFAAFDFTVCVRMHAMILSSMLGIPSVTVEYRGHKSRGACEYLGLLDHYLPVVSDRTLEEKIVALARTYDTVSPTLIDRVERVSGELSDVLLSRLKRLSPKGEPPTT